MNGTDCARILRFPTGPVVAALAAGLMLTLAAGPPLGATTYVPMADADLADQAPLVVEGKIAAAGAAPVSGRPATDYTLDVARVLQGTAPADPLTVRVPGGVSPDGAFYRVWGAPRFLPGDRVLLFLAPRPDGTFGITQLMLGAFVAVETDAGTLALRDLSEARALPGTIPRDGNTAGVTEGREGRVRDLDAFRVWLASRAADEEAPAHYFVDRPADAPRLAERYTLLESSGAHFRWFDGGGTWYAHRGGVPEMASGGLPEVERAVSAWSSDPGSNLTMTYGGATSRSSGFTATDGSNVVLFEDPNDEISGAFDCSTGGVLAIGGFSSVAGQADFAGTTYWRITEGDVVTQDGAGCFFAGNGGKNGELVFAHEIGHALGLGHSCGDSGTPSCADPTLNDALMRAFAHNDGRGARLGADDRAALADLYGDGSTGCTVPAAPSGLSANALSSSRIALAWSDRSADEEDFAVERQLPGTSLFEEIASLPAGTASYTDDGLQADTRYTYQVRAVGCDGESAAAGPASATTDGDAPTDPPPDPVDDPDDPDDPPSDPSPEPPPEPGAPGSLTAQVGSATEVALGWTWDGAPPRAFHVELRSGALFVEVRTVPGTRTGVTLSGLHEDTGYEFRVRARTASGFGPYSNVASADTGDEPGAEPEAGRLSAADVTCDAERLRGLLRRLQVEGPNLPDDGSRAPAVNLSFTATGDFAGIAYTRQAGSSPEHHLAFSTNPEETTLLRNPERPQLRAVSLTRNDLNSDLVGPGHGDLLRLTVDPTLTPGSTPPVVLLTLDNLATSPVGISSAKPGRGLNPLVDPCHGDFRAEDVHVFRVLTKVLRVHSDDVERFEVAIFRDTTPDTYRIDGYGYDGAGRGVGRVAARVTVRWTEGALSTGMLRILPACGSPGVGDGACTNLAGSAEMVLDEPRFRGQLGDGGEVTVRYAPAQSEQGAQPAEEEIDWTALLADSTWRRPPAGSAANGTATQAGALTGEERRCDAARLEGLLSRLRVISPDAALRGVNLSYTRSGDFAGIAYGVGSDAVTRHLAFSTNPEETTLLRNPARPQLFAVSLSRNELNSDLASGSGLVRVLLDPGIGGDAPGGSGAPQLAVDNLQGDGAAPADAKPGRGITDLVAPCHGKLTERDVHLFRVLSKIVRARADGATTVEVAIYRDGAPGTYRIDAYPFTADGTRLGRLAAALEVDFTADGALRSGALRTLPRCGGGATSGCTTIDRPAEIYLVRPTFLGPERQAQGARIGTKNGEGRAQVDFTALLNGTSWRKSL